ncbi:MAG: hypothetical protein MUC59_09325 [Saprospiraceae bacterium]|jgi:hypothetical protein|nr:hypothetical protein [Saprospiraceae bacterium]
MKKILVLTTVLCSIALLSSCKKDEEKATFGTLALEFDNKIGDQELTLADATSTDFKYTNSHNQNFNVSLLGYYITNVKLEGPNGEVFVDPVTTGSAAADVKGIYQVLESDVNSQVITLSNVPSGKYDKVTFTLGIPADIVQEGATGGVLDPAEGAWLWNWDAGYIGFAFEGRSPASPVVATQWNPENSVQIHIGGWKDITDNPMMVNNVKTFTLEFGTSVNVGEKLEPNAHIVMDLLEVIDGHHGSADFTTTNQVHTPAGGTEFAENLHAAFVVDHVHQ